MDNNNNRKLELLNVALQNGAVEWVFDESRGVLYAYSSEEDVESGSPVRTDYWTDIADDGSEWVFCIDRWLDGDTITSAAKLFPVTG